MKKKIIALLNLFFLYIFALLTVNFIYVRIYEIKVVLYSVLISSLISLLIILLIFLKLTYFRIFSKFEAFLFFILLMFTGSLYSLSIPTIVERSLTIYMLEKIKYSQNGIHVNDLEGSILQDYIIEHKVIQKRLSEQTISGTISLGQDNCVRLTKAGSFTLFLIDAYRGNFLPLRIVKLREDDPDLSAVNKIDYLNSKCLN